MEPLSVGQFVVVSDGRVGVITATDKSGGVFRDHADVWFGALDPCFPESHPDPAIEQLLIKDDWKVTATPIGLTDSERKSEALEVWKANRKRARRL